MLSGRESIAQYKFSNVLIWMAMAFQGGFLNVGGFLACGRFVSHVTGYGTTLGVELASRHFNAALAIVAVPLWFMLGSALSGYLVDLRLRLHKRPHYSVVFGLLFCLIGAITVAGAEGVFGTFGHDPAPVDLALLIILAFTCGLQNGTITTVSRAVIRTTHLSGITTDLGVGLVRFLNRRRTPEFALEDQRANLMRIGIITAFVMGSAIGALAFSSYGFLGFVGPLLISGALCVVMVRAQYFIRAVSTK